MEKLQAIEQSRLAFEFIQRLYLEVSILIKEIEALLANQDEKFLIGRPGGYQITMNRSTGLETANVELWLLRKLAVFFIPRACTEYRGGMTWTPIGADTKIIYLSIVLDGKDVQEPLVYAGVLFNFLIKPSAKFEKLERLMIQIEHHDAEFFRGPFSINHEDSRVSFQGEFRKQALFDLNSRSDIEERIVKPMLELFRGINSREHGDRSESITGRVAAAE